MAQSDLEEARNKVHASRPWEEGDTKANEPFITTYLPIAGWKAIHYWWNPEGFWEPWQTSDFAYKTEDEAEKYGKFWAKEEGVRFVPRDRSKSPN